MALILPAYTRADGICVSVWSPISVLRPSTGYVCTCCCIIPIGGISASSCRLSYFQVRTYDPQTVRQTFDLRSHTSKVTCVDSSHPSGYMIATGCHDRRYSQIVISIRLTDVVLQWWVLSLSCHRVRLFDSRQPSSTVRTFMGHAGSVLCVQADDWKIVSGDTEGYVCVWDQRKGVKLWESQSRWEAQTPNPLLCDLCEDFMFMTLSQSLSSAMSYCETAFLMNFSDQPVSRYS